MPSRTARCFVVARSSATRASAAATGTYLTDSQGSAVIAAAVTARVALVGRFAVSAATAVSAASAPGSSG